MAEGARFSSCEFGAGQIVDVGFQPFGEVADDGEGLGIDGDHGEPAQNEPGKDEMQRDGEQRLPTAVPPW